MKTNLAVSMGVLLLALVSLSAMPSMAQRPMSTSDLMKALKPGQWAELEGVVQRDKSVLCTEAKVLTGDFLDDDWGLSGIVEYVDKSKREFRVLGVKVRAQDDAEFESDIAELSSFDGLKPGMFVEVEGTFLKDGTFLASEIEEEEAESDDSASGVEIEVQGKIDHVDPTRRRVQVMGVTFQLTERTKGKSAIK